MTKLTDKRRSSIWRGERSASVAHMTELTNEQCSSRAKNVALWALQIEIAVTFLVAGFGTLSGYPMMVETFDKIGIGQWFRYVTGAIEVASAILLLIPSLVPLGAALLVCTMVGAVLSHLLLIGGSAMPALVLLCFAVIILRGRLGTLKYGSANFPRRPCLQPNGGMQ
jgi:putative oxidoreductase